MSNNKNIYIGAMSGTSHDAIDVSITEIGKDITLKSFFSKRIPNSVRVRIKNIMESDSTTLIELGQLNKKIGHLFAQAINESVKKAKLKKILVNILMIRQKINIKKNYSIILNLMLKLICRNQWLMKNSIY